MADPDFDQKLQITNAVAVQIWREQQLSAARMNWNLTFQGFSIAAFFAVFESHIGSVMQMAIHVVISAIGLSVANATLSGLKDSEKQRDYLKSVWLGAVGEENCDQYPRPFAMPRASRRGRDATNSIVLAIMGMWLVLLIVVLLANLAGLDLNRVDSVVRMFIR